MLSTPSSLPATTFFPQLENPTPHTMSSCTSLNVCSHFRIFRDHTLIVWSAEPVTSYSPDGEM